MNHEPGTVARLRCSGICKSFPGVRALDDVALEVLPGEIHALVGENGAGKSTLMNIVAGVYQPDAGTIEVDCRTVVIAGERHATELGIGIVHQEQSLAPLLSVAENIFAGHPPLTRLGFIDAREMRRRAGVLLAELGASIDPSRTVGTLSPARRQMVEIAKALSGTLRLLILDEPTAALTLGETQHLFGIVRRLATEGIAILFVSHRLGEVFEIASRVTVLKDGKLTGVRSTSDITTDDLVRLMVGRELSFAADPRRVPADAPVVLAVEHLDAKPVHDGSLTVRAGEIVCLAGLIGAGRTELVEAVFGARRITSGTIRVNGQILRPRLPRDSVAVGIGMVPEDRKEGGLFLEMTITENVAASNLDLFSSRGLISWPRVAAATARFVQSLRIATPNLRRRVRFLSGGNQQKVLLARWLLRNPSVLIVDEPTRGVDVGAKAEIYRILRGLASAGTALLVVSSDLPEVLALAHRIVVMADGSISGELDAAEADELTVLRMAAPTRSTVVRGPA